MAHHRPFLPLIALAGAWGLLGCGDDSSPSDAGVAADASSTIDAGSTIDSRSPTADARPGPDAQPGPVCAGMTSGSCVDSSLSCECCPAGGPTQSCLCTTTCNSNADCTDVARPHCNQPDPQTPGMCTPDAFSCMWGAVCAAPDTPIATPTGARAISQLRAGDLVYSRDQNRMVAVPLLQVIRRPVRLHTAVRVVLSNGRTLEISAPHPTADGRTFADLSPGDRLGDLQVLSVESARYEHDATYDILPASDSGTYIAGGALIGTTLSRPAR